MQIDSKQKLKRYLGLVNQYQPSNWEIIVNLITIIVITNDDCAHVNDDCVIWICESDDDDCDDDKNWPVFDHRLLDSTN